MECNSAELFIYFYDLARKPNAVHHTLHGVAEPRLPRSSWSTEYRGPNVFGRVSLAVSIEWLFCVVIVLHPLRRHFLTRCECLSILHGCFAIADLVPNFVTSACCNCIVLFGSHISVVYARSSLGPRNCQTPQRPQEKGTFACSHYFPIQPSLAHRIATLLLSEPSLTLSSITEHLSPVMYHLSSIIYHPLSIVYHLSPIMYRLSPIIHHLSSLIYHLSGHEVWAPRSVRSTSHQPPATNHQPPATSHQPPATSH